ncbi:hypothetical protein EAO82_00600 [Halopseudomonas pelagia]|uniref:Uncharacterized protein n=1 Tax=Halopseudomonas pelagia TaxID=553151 RepID=A0AA91U670_9GAMM|nr:hypothetical protein CO192_00200 [Halopseudomonas pelagia]QFY55000.1 hypothetical protein EAO82_00600 [Halopseudomonas pelagia]
MHTGQLEGINNKMGATPFYKVRGGHILEVRRRQRLNQPLFLVLQETDAVVRKVAIFREA